MNYSRYDDTVEEDRGHRRFQEDQRKPYTGLLQRLLDGHAIRALQALQRCVLREVRPFWHSLLQNNITRSTFDTKHCDVRLFLICDHSVVNVNIKFAFLLQTFILHMFLYTMSNTFLQT